MFKIKFTGMLGAALLIATVSHAQVEKVQQAFKYYSAQKLDSARIMIDQAIVDTGTTKMAVVWNLRGYVYKELYKARERSNFKSPLREEALASFKRSMALDKDAEFKNDNLNNLRSSLAPSFYNDAAMLLDTITYAQSVECYNKFKEIMQIADPEKANAKDVEYNLALGGVYQRLYESNRRRNDRFFDLSQKTFAKVLAIDPDNVSANYNLGILYYNQGATLINEQDYDIDLVAFEQIQDKSKDLFRLSRPYMEKAYQLDQKNESTIKGLCGIYFSLHEKEKYEKFKCKAE